MTQIIEDSPLATVLVTQLARIFMPGAQQTFSLAFGAALQTVHAAQATDALDLITVSQFAGFAMGALNTLALAPEQTDAPLPAVTRLNTSAVSLGRHAERLRQNRVREQHQPPAAAPDPAPMPEPEAEPPTMQPAPPLPPDEEIDFAGIFTEMAEECRSEAARLNGPSRVKALTWAHALSTVVHDLRNATEPRAIDAPPPPPHQGAPPHPPASYP